MNRIELSIPCDSSDRANLLLASLAPELAESVPKSRAAGRIEGETLIISITSPDLAALRAATNSYLRWCDLALRAVDAATETIGEAKEV